ncbi:MAG: accessory Sec system translocase SecA2, partial [Propionibacteriaceae bacterium]|nr:accessory Sec system translocase SecA2 [Propionibacteriaceae bacterium]
MRAIWKNLLGQLVLNSGSQNLGWTKKLVAKAALVGEEMTKLSDADLAQSLRDLDPSFIDSDKQLVRFLAIVRELADRRVGLRPFDVQLRAVAAMLRGISVEMATGEGKTLVGAIVATGLVQAGRQVHVLSANDYLAQRDATWMGPLLTAADFQVAWVTSLSSREDRHAAYGTDVVYVSVTEAGFDVLRDRLAYEPEAQVGIRHDAAIIDEADA